MNEEELSDLVSIWQRKFSIAKLSYTLPVRREVEADLDNRGQDTTKHRFRAITYTIDTHKKNIQHVNVRFYYDIRNYEPEADNTLYDNRFFVCYLRHFLGLNREGLVSFSEALRNEGQALDEFVNIPRIKFGGIIGEDLSSREMLLEMKNRITHEMECISNGCFVMRELLVQYKNEILPMMTELISRLEEIEKSKRSAVNKRHHLKRKSGTQNRRNNVRQQTEPTVQRVIRKTKFKSHNAIVNN